MGADPGWVTGQIPTAAQWKSAWASKADDEGSPNAYYQPTTGQTINVAQGVRFIVVDPTGPLAALTIDLPPNPDDGDGFEVLVTQPITSCVVQALGGVVVRGGASFVFSPDSGAAWRYLASTSTWYRAR